MIGFAGALISLVLAQSWADAARGRSIRASWLGSARLLGTLIAVALALVAVGRLVR